MEAAPELRGGVWWGSFELAEGQTGRWRVGALTLWIRRDPAEWTVAHVSADDPFDTSAEVQVPAEEPLPEEGVTLSRFAARKTYGHLRVQPILPDRPVVSRPEVPFHVLAEDEVRVYVSSPVWVKIEAGRPLRPLLEVAPYRVSDTWFGPNTREGELCYAGRTRCRHEPEDLPRRPQRAVTPVVVRNRAEKTLAVERLNLPAPLLSLYASPAGALWTQPLVVEIAREGATAEIRIERKAPPEAPGAVLLTGPREDAGKNMLTRALGALIG
ncbi:MAG: hypothetical protein Kow0092_16300 [Deferrisomatales bacterium]